MLGASDRERPAGRASGEIASIRKHAPADEGTPLARGV